VDVAAILDAAHESELERKFAEEGQKVGKGFAGSS